MFRIILAKGGYRRPLQRQHALAQLDAPRGLVGRADAGFVSGRIERAHHRKKLGTRIDGNRLVSFRRRGRGGRFSWRGLRVDRCDRNQEQESSGAHVQRTTIPVKIKPQLGIPSTLEFTRPSQPSQEKPFNSWKVRSRGRLYYS